MDYYQVLGVSRNDGEAEIKRAYRRLAISYHPDKNADPKAEDIFKRISEAYGVLSDPEKKRLYDLRLQNPYSEYVQEPVAPPHRDPAYRRPRPHVRRKGERERLRDLMAEYLPAIQKIVLFCFLISLCLLVDFALPSQTKEETITNTTLRKTYSRSYSTTWVVVETSGGQMVDLPYNYVDDFVKGQSITVNSSFFFNIPFSLKTPGEFVPINKTIYGNFLFAPITLLVISSLGLIFRKNIDYGFNLGITSFVILLFILILVLIL